MAVQEATVDEWLWLEEVEGEKALGWVRERNRMCEERLCCADSQFQSLVESLREILDSDQRIPHVYTLNDRVGLLYNLWRDKSHELGLWRRTTLSEYRKGTTCLWESVLDLDELAATEHTRWVFAGASDCIEVSSSSHRCLCSLSRGGSDATVTREFDVDAKCFVSPAEGGFERPEAKGGLSWVDAETVLAHTDFFDGQSMTKCGYSRSVRLWRRGEPLSAARLLCEIPEADLVLAASHDPTPGFERDVFTHCIDFYHEELLVAPGIRGVTGGATIAKVTGLPADAKKSLHRGWLILELRTAAFGYPAGALIATRLDQWLANTTHEESVWKPLFVPTARAFLRFICRTPTRVLLTVLDNVLTRIFVATPPADTDSSAAASWTVVPFATEKYGLPSGSTLYARTLDDVRSEAFFVQATSYLAPSKLFHGVLGDSSDGAFVEQVRTAPEQFDASGLIEEQFHATSLDGTVVPYTVVHSRGMKLDGNNPTMMHAYGGFEHSLLPAYIPLIGKGWLNVGGVFVEANIRGGGEFGPAWHQAALKANRTKAFEDLEAVVRDLFARRITCAAKLALRGGSNGGLLVLNAMLRHPELYGAIVCMVPLADMKRYSHLLAGHSWMAEYGDPDSSDWDAFLRALSPYHNIPAASQSKLPPILFTTSTRDDRVHPGHARKMVARLLAAGHTDVLLFENIEGGHGGAASNAQTAKLQALSFTFLRQRLF